MNLPSPFLLSLILWMIFTWEMLTGALGALVKDVKKKLYSSYCIENCVINTKKVKNVSFYGNNYLF